MTRLIGISSQTVEHKHTLNTAYINAFTRGAVTPIILPVFAVKNRELMTPESFAAEHKDHIDRYVDRLDSLCVSGGVDINALSFDGTNYASNACDTIRDYMETALVKAFMEAGKPIIGICRGLQVIGHVLEMPNFKQDLGGTDENHDGNAFGFTKRQEAVHRVWPRGAYREYLESKTGRDVSALNVNSWHHQGYTLVSNGKLPKFREGGDFWDWLNKAVAKYEADAEIDILSTTPMVIEGFESPARKIVAWANHPEESGPDSLAIGYFIDRYLS